MPPAVCTDRVCQAACVVVGVGAAVEFAAEEESEDEVVEVEPCAEVGVDAGTVVLVVVVCWSVITGAATFRGAIGRSLTWSSAALTICQVSCECQDQRDQPYAGHRQTSHTRTVAESDDPTSLTGSQGSVKPGSAVERRDNLAAMARVVLVEDDVEIRRLVAEALADQGHDVESAAAAIEGLELAVKARPDLGLARPGAARSRRNRSAQDDPVGQPGPGDRHHRPGR